MRVGFKSGTNAAGRGGLDIAPSRPLTRGAAIGVFLFKLEKNLQDNVDFLNSVRRFAAGR